MAGLLKQLQKKRLSRSSSMGAVILRKEDSVGHSAITEMDQQKLDAADLLKDLLSESGDRPIVSPRQTTVELDTPESETTGSSRLKVVRRNRDNTGSTSQSAVMQTEDAPWWLNDQRILAAQVERLVLESQKYLSKVCQIGKSENNELEAQVQAAVSQATDALQKELRLSLDDRKLAEREVLNLLSGKGPLQPLFEDTSITDIFIDDHKSVRVIRSEQALETPFQFRSAEEYRWFVDTMLASVQRGIDEAHLVVDCVLDDVWRSRMNVLHGSLFGGEEPRVSIRIPRIKKIAFYDLLQQKVLPATLAAWLAEIVDTREANLLVVGPAGSGKTLMTSALLSGAGSGERIVTIEDLPEIASTSVHMEKLMARPGDQSGKGAISKAQLIEIACQRSPHRIVLGNLGQSEAFPYLQALETGLCGSIATMHADSAADAVWRYVDFLIASEAGKPEHLLRRLARSIHLIVTLKRIDGSPCVTDVSELVQQADGSFFIDSILEFAGVEEGKRKWRLMTKTSTWMQKIERRGLVLKAGGSVLNIEAA